MTRFDSLVNGQISWMKSQIARFPPGHARHRPDQIAMYERLIEQHEQLLSYLQSQPDGAVPNPAPHQTSTRAAASNLDGLPPELLKELSGTVVAGDSDPLVDLIDEMGGTATLDELLIGMFRKHGELNKRNLLANRLYRLGKRSLVRIHPGRKGVYSTMKGHPDFANERQMPDDISLFQMPVSKTASR